MTVLTLFDSDRARGAVYQTPCKWRVARVLRCTLGAVCTARSALGAVRRRRTVFTARGVKRRRSHFFHE